jgi:hypothetical protein
MKLSIIIFLLPFTLLANISDSTLNQLVTKTENLKNARVGGFFLHQNIKKKQIKIDTLAIELEKTKKILDNYNVKFHTPEVVRRDKNGVGRTIDNDQVYPEQSFEVRDDQIITQNDKITKLENKINQLTTSLDNVTENSQSLKSFIELLTKLLELISALGGVVTVVYGWLHYKNRPKTF